LTIIKAVYLFISAFVNVASVVGATGNLKVTISAPVAVIHWIGRKANISDVHAGLVLQRHAPFVFHFDNIALINPTDTKAISTLLDLLASPEVTPTKSWT